MNKFIVRVCVSLIVIAFIVSGLVGKVFAGLIMEQVRYEKGSSQKNKGTIYISKNKIKFVEGSGQGVVIFDLNTSEMIQIDNEKKRYVVAKPEEYFKFVQDATAKMKAELEAQLSKLPPEQRAQMEEMMKSQGITPPGSKPKTLTLKSTGMSEPIAGYKSQKFELYRDSKLSKEIWTSKDVVSDKELDSKKMASYMKEMEKMISKSEEELSSNLDEEAKIFNQVYESGFPMKSVDYSFGGDVYIEEIVKVTKADIPDNEFQAPTGYKKVTLQQMMLLE